ncbi:MAG: ABC transporter ATP-binding protein [Actinobacteria bacterium]|nr:ABC transporter ATP-binding protein [Actinomycetota bacterium]
MERELVVDARGIGKDYGRGSARFSALKDVTLQIAKGECVAIVGKSGSGKSTLMHVLALLDAPDSGTLAIDGVDTKKLSTGQLNTLRNRTFGFVFQQFFLTPGTSVLDNVTLPLEIAGLSPRLRREKGMAVLEQLELADKARSNANDLSGGQKQRVVIARALVGNPGVIFADEPTGNLDSATGAVVEETLFALNRDHGITLIIVTHDDELAARCDRQIFLRDGAIVSDSATTGVAA